MTIAGPFSFTVCRPPSISRVTLKSEPSTSSLEAKVACDQPSSAASIWPVWLLSSSIACLPRMIRPGCSSSATFFRIFATASGSTLPSAFTEDAAVGAHGQTRADRFRRLRRTNGDDDDLGRLAGFLEAQRFLDRDFVERIHRHLDVGEFNARSIALDADLDVVIDHPLYRH